VSWAAVVPDVTPLRGPGARGFRAMFTSRTVAYLGSQAAEVALLVQAQRITGSPLVVGTLGLAELVRWWSSGCTAACSPTASTGGR
jgi:hypothetical protein